jgi:DNA-binding MarR family transcriptional regulator
MTNAQSHEAAKAVLKTVPLVMRAIAARLRTAGELPAPAHYGLLSMLEFQSRTLTELATLQGVSLPTMSNSISAMVQRGWVTRSSPVRDRRVVIIEITASGRSALKRVRRAAESHLATILQPLTPSAGRRVHGGLTILLDVFARQAELNPRPRERRRKA